MSYLDCLRTGVILSLVSFSWGSDLKVGFAEFQRESPGASPAASSLFSMTNSDGILFSEAGVESVGVLRRGRIFVQQERQIGTGIALANPSESSVSLNLVLRNQKGQLVGREENYLIEAHQHVARFVSELFQDVPETFTGSLTFEGIGPLDRIAAVTLRQSANDFGEPLLTTLPVVDLDGEFNSPAELSSGFVFPHIGAGPGFSTQLMLINRGPTRVEGLIHLVASDGQDLELQSGGRTASSFPFEISGDGVFFSEFVAPLGGALGVGYARIQVTAGRLPTGSAVFRFTDGAMPISEAGVGAPPAMKKARLFVDNRDTSTGFAVVNPNTEDLKLHLKLYDANGRLLAESSRRLGAGNHLAQFAGEAFPLSKRFVGLLEITSNTDFVPITLKLSQNSRGHSILTTLPVSNIETPDSDTLLVLPQVATGSSVIGEFLTRLIFMAPVQGHNVGGNLQFWQGSGEPLELTLFDGEVSYFIEDGALGEFVFSETTAEPMLDRRESVSTEVGPEGGSLLLENCSNARVDLYIPPYALLAPREVKMTCLGARPVDTLGVDVFPGVALEPTGLLFRYPAELMISLPEPLDDFERHSILTLGTGRIPHPVANDAAGDTFVGEIRHFSEYWVELVNLSDLIGWIDKILAAKQNPEFQEKILESFRKEMGYELDLDRLNPKTMDFLLRFGDLDSLADFRRMIDELGVDPAKVPDVFRDFLEVLVLDFIATSFPENPCGYFHSFAIELQKLSENFLEINPQLDARIRDLDRLCIVPDLNGFWRGQPGSESETCWRTIKPIEAPESCEDCGETQKDQFSESDSTESFLFLVQQVGSDFTISFPGAPETPFLFGSLEATGSLAYPFHFRLAIPPGVTRECETFFETKGSFEWGDPICDPASAVECEPISCRERERVFARITADYRIEGVSRWTTRASVKEWLEGCCNFFQSIVCRGSGLFIAAR